MSKKEEQLNVASQTHHRRMAVREVVKEPKDGAVFVEPEEIAESNLLPQESISTTVEKAVSPEESSIVKTHRKESVEVDPSRNYSRYYTPRPAIGERGGRLGRGAVNDEDRKIQFSITCTKSQKEEYKEAADKEGLTLPNFVNRAITEYIKNHNL